MTDSKITDLTALTGANLATGDKFVMVDVSDTTMAASGTDKSMSAAELADGLRRQGGLIGCTQYGPSARTGKTTTSTSLAAIDTTNMTVSFTAPASGQVLVRLTAFVVTAAGVSSFWALFTHGTTTQVGNSMQYASGAGNVTVTTACLVTGLTPGTTYQWDWAWGVQSGTATIEIQATTGVPASFALQGAPAVMEVWAA